MALRQRLSRPFGRPSPPFREEEAMGDLVKLIREDVGRTYTTGWSVRTRSCDGKTKVEMLDGTGGETAGFANGCDIDDPVISPAGYSELWWSQRSNGRTVRLLFDGPRGGKGMKIAQRFPPSRPLPAAPGPVTLNKAAIVIGGNSYQTFTCLARSEDGGETWVEVESDNFPGIVSGGNARMAACYGSGTFLIGGSGANQIAYSTDGGATWTGCGAVFGTNGYCTDIVYNGAYFVAAGNIASLSGYVPIAYSANGINWTLVPDANCTGDFTSTNNQRVDRLGLAGTRIVCIGYNGSRELMCISVDNGAHWASYYVRAEDAPQAIVPPEFDNALGGYWSLMNVHPLALAGTATDIVAFASHSSVPSKGMNHVFEGGIWGDAVDPTADPCGIYGAAGTWCSDGVGGGRIDETQSNVVAEPGTYEAGDTRVISGMIHDGTQYIVFVDWWGDGGENVTTLAWIATSTDGKTWTRHLESYDDFPLASIGAMVYTGSRYIVAGGQKLPEQPIGVAWTDDLTGEWTAATGTMTYLSFAYNVAIEE